MIYLNLLIGFLKVGCFAFGGAYAAIPLIRDVVLSYGWLGDEELAYMIAVSESTPGPIMVNLATYVGSSQGGILGAALATLAVILPAFLIVLAITAVMRSAMDHPTVQAVLRGVKPCIVGIILATGLEMACKGLLKNAAPIELDWRAVGITAFLAVVYFGSEKIIRKKISPILLILIAAICGIVVYSLP